MAQITLYGSRPYDRSAKVRWLLEELEVPFENRWLDTSKQENESESYKKVSPLGRFPALTIDDRHMIESNAICNYLADLYADRGLAPAMSSPDRMLYQQWMFFASSLDSFIGRIMIVEDIPAGEVFNAKRETLLSEVNDHIQMLELALKDREYLLGKFSAADICIGYQLYFASLWPEMGTFIEGAQHVVSFLKRLKERKGATKANVFSFTE